MTELRDLGLTLPLDGVRLIEASAGTGKTFVLATLYSRAVIELGLPVDALLALTFTKAATQELRTRVRERLALAQRFADDPGAVPAAAGEASTHALVAAALAAGEPRGALRGRLRAAAEAMDLAPVFTIHAFCQRALADHAIEAGLAPGDVELVTNERALREEVATDLWRAVCADPDDARALAALYPSPAKLGEALRDLWAIEDLQPPAVAPDAAADRAAGAAREQARLALIDACARLGDETCAAMFAAIATGGVHKGTHPRERVEKIHDALRRWVEDRCEDAAPKDLDVLGTRRLGKAVTKAHVGKVAMPCNALTDAIDAWHAAAAAVAAHAADRRVALVHRLRDDGRDRLAALKKQRQLQGFDDLVREFADALAGPSGDALAARLQAQYRLAFVDEFQDTDPRQWAIFHRLFAQAPDDGGPRALFLIGDPKQAIYRFRGGDVHTYLEARAVAGDGRAHALHVNYRSRPALLRALDAVYAGAGAEPFGEKDVGYDPTEAGGKHADDALTVAGVVAPAFEVLTWDDADGLPDADGARERAAIACAARIRELLQPDVRIAGRAVAPGDIAVLVASHREARLVQRWLGRAGVPSVAAARNSLYDSDEAIDVLAVLLAALHLSDDARLRAAMATPLLGQSANDIAALDGDDLAHRAWQDRALGWRQRWERHGPLALVTDLCAAAAPRVLAQDGGERRLANWLQLGEALQAEASGREPAFVAARLAERIADADPQDDEELLRLESDAARVRIATLHASKGLEFPIVVLPFLSHARAKAGGPAWLARHHVPGTGRVGHLHGTDEAEWKRARKRDADESAAERKRLLYVGLTRAQLATIVGFGPFAEAGKAPFAHALFGGDVTSDAATLRPRLDALAAASGGGIVVREAATQLPAGRPETAPTEALPAAATPRRLLSRDWSVHSFSALAREAGGADARRAGDEREPVQLPNRFAGARFGNVLHDALEHVDFAAWRDWRGDAPPPGQAGPLERALRGGGYGADLDEGLPLLAALVRDTLNARMPEGVRLADLPPEARVAELEFHFDLAPADVPALLALLHAHGLVSARAGFGTRARLEGLLTGFVDLVYEHAGRVHVLDYKSNVLPAYDDAALREAMAHGEYDLQYLLYVLALHRWLGRRIDGYDYDTHVGGVRYLFCRGLGAGGGLYATRPPRALVEGLDALLRRAEAAA